MPGLSLDPASMIQALLGNQAQQEKNTEHAVADIADSFQVGEQKAAESIDQQREVVANAGATAAAKANIDYTQHKLTEDLQRQFNMNPDDLNNDIAKNLAAADQARAARVSVRSEYDSLASTDLLSNPIGYMLAQLKLPAVAARNNALADAEDEALGNIQTKTATLAAVKNTLTANIADSTREVQLKQAQNERDLANARLTGEEAKVAVQTAANQMQLFQLQNKTLDDRRNTIIGVSSIAGRAEARADARQAREDANADRDESRKLRAMQLEEMLNKKKEDKEEEDRLNVRLLTVSQSLGMKEPMTLKTLKTLTNKKEQMIWLQAAQTGQLGDDLRDSLQFYLGRGNRTGIQQGGGASLLLNANKMAEAGSAYEVQATRELGIANPGKAPKREDAQKHGFELYSSEITNATNSPAAPVDMSSSKWDRTYNPYKVQFLSFNTAVGSHPELAPLKTNIVKTTIDDLVKSGSVTNENLSSDQQQHVLSGIIAKVRARQLDPKTAAADIATYYKSAAEYNQRLTRPEMFGLAPQESYVFTLDGSFGDSSRKKTNLFDPNAVENAIVWQIKQSREPFGGSPVGGFR